MYANRTWSLPSLQCPRWTSYVNTVKPSPCNTALVYTWLRFNYTQQTTTKSLIYALWPAVTARILALRKPNVQLRPLAQSPHRP